MRTSPIGDEQRKPAAFWLTLLACAVYVFLFAFSVSAVARHFGVRKDAGWSVNPTQDGWVVSSVNPAGPAVGRIEPGDRLLAINGDERSAALGLYRLRDVEVGASYHVDFDRHGNRVQVELPVTLIGRSPLQSIFLLFSPVFFVCGTGLVLVRPQDPQVRLIGWTLMMVGAGALIDVLRGADWFLIGWERWAYFVILCCVGWAFPMGYHFFSRFPVWRSPVSLWRGIQWLLYAAWLLIFWPAWVVTYLVSLGVAEGANRFFAEHPTLYLTAASVTQRSIFIYFQLCFVLGLVVTAYNYRRLRDPDSRRRIRWVVAGLMATIPWLAVMFMYWVAGWMGRGTYNLAYPLSSVVVLCIPASIVVAVWKEQLFDIKVLVRRGLQYLLARTALRILLVLPFAVLTLSVLSNPNRTLIQILTEGAGWLNLVWIGAIAATLRFRHTLQSSLDRRFFREAYEQEQVLLQLMDEVRQRDSTDEIARLVSARIESVLHPTALHVFYRAQEHGEMIAGHSSSGTLTGRDLSQHQAILRIMEGETTVRDFPSGFEGRVPENERRWLEELGVRLVVPITGRQDRLVGLLLLGERMSDEPYPATDRRLLQGIAAQIGLVYENQHLRDKVRSDADVRRHVLARLDEQRVNLLKECPACGACYDSSVARCEKDEAELELTLPVERTLDGKYRLDRALGRGGMGAVYEATDLRLHRLVAAKVMIGSLFGDQKALRRFEREARAAAKLDHRHITRVYDYGTIGSGGAYLIMELIAGKTWRTELQRSGVIAPARAAEWFRQLLEGVRFAHDAGIIHRDLKPENVMVVQTSGGYEELKIMDFGLAKINDAEPGVTESLTMVGGAMGTLGYMAPEALSGGPVDGRADIFAIGVMVVEALTGARPFAGQTPQEVILALVQSSYRLPGESAEVRALDAVVQRCLTRDPQNRYASVAELANDLLPALRRCGTVERGPGLGTLQRPTFGEFTR